MTSILKTHGQITMNNLTKLKKTCDLIGEDLDYAVAYSKGYTLQTAKDINGDSFKEEYKPSTNWERGGHIIEEKRITIIGYDNQWEAHLTVGSFVDSGVGDWISGPTPLIAAMRAYVLSVLGEEVHMPFIRLMFQDKTKAKQMKIKTCDLKVKELDFVVAQLEAIDVDDDCYTFDYGGNPDAHYSPSQHWHQAGPIIERENIAITGISFPWFATEMGWWGHIKDVHNVGTTPLIAAMRCYVQSKWGKEVDMKTVYEALQIEKEEDNE